MIKVKVNELNISDVVKYFVEKSGMLFFYTRDDVKVACDRIYTILKSEEKYHGVDVKRELSKLNTYYNYFIKNFNEYSQNPANKSLFIDIMKVDNGIMFCGSESSLDNYMKNLKANLEEANSAMFFFQRRYAVKEGMRKFAVLVKKINEYKNSYGIDIYNSFIDDILLSLGLDTLSEEDEIVKTYNKLLDDKYKNIVDVPGFKQEDLIEASNEFAYIRDIISQFYDLGENLEKRTLVEIYSQPLSSEPEYYEAFRYFKLDINCTKEEMIDVVETVIDDIMSTELVNNVSMKNNGLFIGGYPFNDMKKNSDAVLNKANYYKDILYRYFGVNENNVEATTVENENSNNFVNESYASVFSKLFDGLDFNDARKLYFTLMNNLLNSDSEKNASKIKELDSYWNSIKDTFEQIDNISSNKKRR